PAGFVQQPRLDGGLVDSVLAEGIEWIAFLGRHRGVMAVDPDGSAMKVMFDFSAEGLDEVLSAGEIEGDHIDHDVGSKGGDAGAENAGAFLGRSIDGYLLRATPGGMGPVGLRL